MQKGNQMSVCAHLKNTMHFLHFEQSNRLSSRNGNSDVTLWFPMAEAFLSIVRTILRDAKHLLYKATHPKHPLKKKHWQLAERGRVHPALRITAPQRGLKNPPSSLWMLPTLFSACFKSIMMGRKFKLEISGRWEQKDENYCCAWDKKPWNAPVS